MKILILLIFSPSPIYNEMLQLQKKYINNHANIDTYFITLNEEQSKDIIVKDDVIFVKGKESHTNILFKTIESLSYINNINPKKYDFIIRSNISTIINLDNLYNYLLSIPDKNVYTGGKVETLQWLLQTYEVSEKKQENRNDYYGLKYIQGIGIILSNDIVEKILKIKENIEYDIVDDVKLGILIRDYFPEIYEKIGNGIIAKISYNNFEEDSVFIRNRSRERKMDIHRMRNIIDNKFKSLMYPNFDKIIYITHKIINEKLLYVKNEWEKLNPEYKVELYDDERCIDFLYKYYGNKYCDIFKFIPDGPIKSDFFRVCLIYIFGGIYVDSDIKPLVPLNNYIEDDLDFMTCISYNYFANRSIRFCYNPQMIISKKYSDILFKCIHKYEHLYDCNEAQPYSYWSWSICAIFEKFESFNITINGDNIFTFQNKKYKFIIEEISDRNTNNTYNFTNFAQHEDFLRKKTNLDIYCKYMNNIVLKNFDNK